jgi:hypothetical protein
MSLKKWPSNSEYVHAVHDLTRCFEDPDLRNGSIRPGTVIGLPECATGQNAIVFPVQNGTRKWAVRCFTTPAPEGRQRYEAFSSYVSDLYIPSLVDAEWLETGIRTDSGWWPVVKMEWIAGKALHDVVASYLDTPERLQRLSDEWRGVARDLRNSKIAHGDLQHGNILIDPRNRLRLVDYDGIWVPELADVRGREVGHPNYQHPERIATGAWDEHIDAFSALVIYVSLCALAADSTLWEFHNGECLVFRADDYVDPGLTAIWKRLKRSPDPDVVDLASLLAAACRTTVRVPTDLEQVLTTRRIAEGAPYRSTKTAGRQWWQPDYHVAAAKAADAISPVVAEWPDTSSGAEDADDEAEIDGPDAGKAGWSRDWRVLVAFIFVLLTLAVGAAMLTIDLLKHK